MKRTRFTLLLGLLALFLMSGLVTPTSSIPQPVSALQDIEPLPFTEGKWLFADLPEGAVIENNREDYIDQLSSLHEPDDIGTHSNVFTMTMFDGVFNTLTSDNITIPEQLIEDPMNETEPYLQPAYESWRLDLEGGWTDVDYDEVSAELCVYGGIQAAEALRVAIWDNDGWIAVIDDVQVGWNNVSIASSLVDETLEMRFAGSNTGNTSVQNSWEIDAVLLHTWTTIYDSEYTQSGLLERVGEDLFRYASSVGEMNTYNEETGTWHRYLYDADAKSVKIGNLTITHLEDGALSVDGDAGSRIGRLSWFIQAYYGDQWNNITLDNYQFMGFTKTEINVTTHQRFWGTQGEMNIYLTYSYFGGFKTRVDIRNDAAQAVPIRAIWAAQDVSGIQDNYNLLYNDDGVLYGIQVEDATFSWGDVLASDNPLPIQTVIDKPNRRAAVVFGNQSTIVPVGYTATIDPTYTVEHDDYDNYWDDWEGEHTRYDGVTINKLETDGSSKSYQPTYSIALAIPKYAIITSAITEVYVRSWSGATTATVYRLNTANAGVLEDAAWIDTDFSLSSSMQLTGILRGEEADVGEIVQKQINIATWTSGWRIGLRVRVTSVSQHTVEDFSHTETHHSKITVTFQAPASNWLSGWTYRQGHSIDGRTGAGTNYAVKINVEYDAGTSGAGTIYCDTKCQPDFDDIRFTNSTGEGELDYWIEEKTDSDDATFWVEVTEDLDEDRIIYVYYGNAGASTTSSGTDTFFFFDDFEDGTLDKWDANNNFEIKTDRKYGSYSAGVDTTSAGAQLEWDSPTTNTPIAFHFSMNSQNVLRGGVVIPYTVQDKSEYAGYVRPGYESSTSKFYYYDGTFRAWGSSNDDITSDNWFEFEVWVDFDNSDPDMKAWHGNTWPLNYDGEEDWHEPDDTDPESIQMEWFRLATQSNYEAWFDNVFIRKIVYTGEPAHYTWGAEEAPPLPEITQAPIFYNPSDTDNMYAHYIKYRLIVYVSHPFGFAYIDYLEFGLWNNANDTEFWRGRYDEGDDEFSEVFDAGGSEEDGYVILDTEASSATKNGDFIDASFNITIDWDFPDSTNLDLRCFVIDTATGEDREGFETFIGGLDADVETRLDIDNPLLNDGLGTGDRGDYNTVGGIEATGRLLYYDSVDNYPPIDEVDVWVTCPDTPDGDWNATNYNAGTGLFSVDVDSDNVITPNVVDVYTFKAVPQGTASGGTDLLHTTRTDSYSPDHMTFAVTANVTWTVIGYYVNVTGTGTYVFDGVSVPSIVWSLTTGEVTYSTVGNRTWYYTSTGDTYGITSVTNGTVSVIWDDVVPSGAVDKKWSQYTSTEVLLTWGMGSNWMWDHNDSLLNINVLFHAYANTSLLEASGSTYGSGAFGGLTLGYFTPQWHYVSLVVNCEVTISGIDYDWEIWSQVLEVDILHSLQLVVFSITPTDYHFWIVFQTNLMNASIIIWDDVVNSGTLFSNRIYPPSYPTAEGMHQIPIDDNVGIHNYTICITSTGVEYDKDFTVHDYVIWYNFTNVVPEEPSVFTTNIIIIDNLGQVIDFNTFEVFKNGSRLYYPVTVTYSNQAYNITVKDRWGSWLNTTAVFPSGDFEFVVTVEVYSLKVMSWFEDFVFFNITHGGLTYTEVVAPLETIDFLLFTGTYDWVVDYRNGSTVEGDITLTGSTAIIVTGSTIADVAGYSATLLAMTTQINVTVSATNNYVLTISIDLTNINTTIGNQLIQVLLNITNINSTLYLQTVDLLAYVQNVNSTLFDQTVLILLDIENMNTTLYTQTVTLLSNIENVNSTIYAQTVWILSNITNVNSTIYSQILTVLSNIENLNATMYLINDPTHLNPMVLGYSLSDDYCDFTVVTNWHNASIDIYDNNVHRTGPTSELLCPIRYPLLGTSGTHNLSLFIDAGADSFWYNISYTIPEILAFDISLWDVEFLDVYVNIFIKTTFGNATLYIFDNNIYKAFGSESDVLIYRKDSTQGIHNLSIKIDSGGSNVMWKNTTYTVAFLVTELRIVDIKFDTGSQDSVTGLVMTNWGNASIVITQSGNVLAVGTEGGIGLGVPFVFRKAQTAGVIHLVTITITSGISEIILVLGYSYSDPFIDSTFDPMQLVNQTLGVVEEYVGDVLSDVVIMPPAVLGGLVGTVVLLIVVIVGQMAWHWKGKHKKKRGSDLLGMVNWLPGVG